MSNWYRRSVKEIREEFDTDIYKGLSHTQVQKRLDQSGGNILSQEKKSFWVRSLLNQIKSPLVFILIIAGIVVLFLREFTDAIVIGAALFINIIIGLVQEGRADKAFKELQKFQTHEVTVIRDGKREVITSQELVEGDVIVVEVGMYVPADARLIEALDISANESILTGEWIDRQKHTKDIREERVITEQENMIWMGTLITAGSGKALVVATGNKTELGKIAASLGSTKSTMTPLQKSIKNIARFLVYTITFVLVGIFAIGIFRGEPLAEMFLVAVAIAVAAMPEGLPAAVTVVLAIAMENILKHKGLVRNLLAAETLGSTTIIITDKTGTLTKGDMALSHITTLSSLRHPDKHAQKIVGGGSSGDERDVLAMATLTSDAFVEGYDNALGEWIVHGRPVERAVVEGALHAGLEQDKLRDNSPIIDEIPFESRRRVHITLHGVADKKHSRMYVAGAPELLIKEAQSVYFEGKAQKLTDHVREQLKAFQEEESKKGMRLIAVGYKDVPWKHFDAKTKGDTKGLLEGVTFGGFIVLHDPIRESVAESIGLAQKAHVHVIMATGDNEYTALRVAQEVGIAKGNTVLTGLEVEEMSDEELLNALTRVSVFARMLPAQKKRMAQLLQKENEVIAMTGDGVNDAPALKQANIGIALGSGTEVAKEASDLILLDNSFTIIVRAIEEGRRALANLKKIIAYLLSTSFSEIFVVGGALIAGAPLPLLPAQILWTNIVEEGFMNFAFAFEPKDKHAMRKDPRKERNKKIITNELRSLIFIMSLVTGVLLISLYFFLLHQGKEIDEIRTTMFVLLSIDSIFFSFSLKDLSEPLWRINIFSNRYLLFAIGTSVAALAAAIFVPPLARLLSVVPLALDDVLFIFGMGIVNLAIIEILKYIYFERRFRP